jgi:hypothetical protein
MPSSGKVIDAIRSKDIVTKRKFYTPTINGDALLKQWNTKTDALAYGNQVFRRYILLMNAHNALRKEKKDGV